MSEQWLSIHEYAKAYRISDITIRRRIRSGKLPAVLREGKYFISTSTPIEAQVPEKTFRGAESHDTTKPSLQKKIGHVPSHIVNQFEKTNDPATIQLLEFCDRALKNNAQLLHSMTETFQAKEKMYAAQIDKKDHEMLVLKQQVEDLQVLVELLEKK